MPKPKQFLKPDKRKSKHAPRLPTSPEEYLEDGVAFEESGEKWRAGDAAKSTRFFVRAIDCYQAGLEKFPWSFDLAYNKARIQFELTQYPKLLQHLPGTRYELLQTALESSRYALKLKEDDAETLFNAAQILTSLFEADDERPQDHSLDPLKLLEEALDLFSRCLSTQEELAKQSRDQAAAAKAFLGDSDAMEAQDPTVDPDAMETDDSEGGVPLFPGSVSASGLSTLGPSASEEQWASIVEPVTNNTLLDTLLAQLETLTSLVKSIPSDSKSRLVSISSYAAGVLDNKLVEYTSGTGREQESDLARANYVCAFADARFLAEEIGIIIYTTTIETAYKSVDLSNHAVGLCDLADSMISYNSNLRSHPQGNEQEYLQHRWTALTLALTSLASASKIQDAGYSPMFNLPKIHIKRGDCELWRYQLGKVPTPFEPAVKNAAVLLKNAGTFYKGAEASAQKMGFKDEPTEALLKSSLVKAFQGDPGDLFLAEKYCDDGSDLLIDCENAGLITPDQMGNWD